MLMLMLMLAAVASPPLPSSSAAAVVVTDNVDIVNPSTSAARAIISAAMNSNVAARRHGMRFQSATGRGTSVDFLVLGDW